MKKDIKRIVVIGPESTGKSTLAQALATHFHTSFVPEYARLYLEQLGRPYEENDLLAIAQAQIKEEDQWSTVATNNLLFCDTDLYVIKVWSEHKYGNCHRSILEEIATRRYDLYLLTDIDMPWHDDPLREHPEPRMRQYFYHIYLDIVQHSGCPFVQIKGTAEQRLTTAIQAIKHYALKG